MPRAAALLLLLDALSLIGCSDEGPSTPTPAAQPVRVVLVIGDGMGHGALDAARIRAGALHMEDAPVVATVDTRNVAGDVTDSGAAATALASGTRTYNRAIGVGPDSLPVRTVVEDAEACGLATGLVATSSLTHATPASFATHVLDRALQFEIARQLAGGPVDVLVGGGYDYFSAETRQDGQDLLTVLRHRGCDVVRSVDDLAVDAGECVAALLDRAALPPASSRAPTLAELALLALDLLERDPDGFFLMVEGSQIDWAAHENDGEWMVSETLDLDQTIAELRTRLAGLPGSLLVVTADHETGGVSATEGETPGSIAFAWTTLDHTAQPVPLFAWGQDAPDFATVTRNDEVGALLRSLVECGMSDSAGTAGGKTSRLPHLQ